MLESLARASPRPLASSCYLRDLPQQKRAMIAGTLSQETRPEPPPTEGSPQNTVRQTLLQNMLTKKPLECQRNSRFAYQSQKVSKKSNKNTPNRELSQTNLGTYTYQQPHTMVTSRYVHQLTGAHRKPRHKFIANEKKYF